ncbi:glutamic acid-rich protein (garp) [Reticulomyxa filosa]|uniref:Glutamic acid-rich protein (Garp) n=1 Tax=Reticulomyxa filosa TaxID=46433 RepID=X6NPP5_RETFI|nr:glutamic acid-rich protein (garp) [Reticulomyxa filosa]|eukprot:ETO27674.1 glutamic acid-rich protein (garp) [Reticulomyxa filosa]
MAAQKNDRINMPSLSFIRPDMTVQEKVVKKGKNFFAPKRLPKRQQQLEIEKRQWEQERDFGFKLIENLRQRVQHYVLKIELIAQFYNIDVSKLDSLTLPTLNANATTAADQMPLMMTKLDVGNNSVMTNSSDNNAIEELYEQSVPTLDSKQQARKMFERKRQESEDLRKECQTLEKELKELRRKQVRTKKRFQNNKKKLNKGTKARNSKEETIDTMESAMHKAQRANGEESTLGTLHKASDETPLRSSETHLAFSENQLLAELSSAWSEEFIHLLKQVLFAHSIHVILILRAIMGQITSLNNGLTTDSAAMKEILEEANTRMKLKSNQALEKHRNRRLQLSEEDEDIEEDEYEDEYEEEAEEEEEENENGLHEDENGLHEDENGLHEDDNGPHKDDNGPNENDYNQTHNDNDRNYDNGHQQKKTQEKAEPIRTNEQDIESQSKRYLSGQMPPSRIVLSKLSNRKDTELDIHDTSQKSTVVDRPSSVDPDYSLEREIMRLQHELEECKQSKNTLILRTAFEMERMRELLKLYNPNFRYRRILDRLLEDNRYKMVLDKLADETYQPHELDAFLAHIAHLKYQNKFNQ